MIAFKARSLGSSVAQARLAGTPSRIPTAATMTWRMPLPARRRSPNSADTTRACAGCRATTTTAATPGSASVFKTSSTAGGASDYEFIQALTTVVRGINDLEGLVPTLAELGRRHAQYGVANGHYDTVSAAFLWTLEQRLDRHGRHRWRPPGPTPTVAGVMRGATNEPQAKFDDEANRSIQQVPSL